ncbi:hypothetical protein KHQ81_02875 [Mycoplasmatota bacterium]|nr:hypothetical protein KHQ81_02875 [Mycoplasmatota bacterium]
MIEIFRENIKQIRNRFEIVDLLNSQQRKEEACDILRFQIVYAMSALDFFMHEIYSYALLKIFRNESPKTDRYNEYKIPLKLLEQALYDAENIDHYLKETFIDLNRNYTFMSPGRIRELLNIISSEDEFAMVEKSLKAKNIISKHKRLDRILDEIYDRRNKIAHQTDINHGKDDKNAITKDEVEFYINIISHLVESLYQVICLNK